MFTNSIPFVPNRLSYCEIYSDYFKYPSEWTITWDDYLKNKDFLITAIKYKMNHFGDTIYKHEMQDQKQIVIEKFINPAIMYDCVLK